MPPVSPGTLPAQADGPGPVFRNPATRPAMFRTWAEIDLSALRHNLAVAKEVSGVDAVMAVVKADAYGHGLARVADAIAPDVQCFGVAHAAEARFLDEAGVGKPVHLLGPTTPDERPEIVSHRWVPTLSSMDEATHFDELAADGGRPLPVHLSVDTGMGRDGFLPETLYREIGALRALENLQIEGLGSHLPSADEDAEFTRRQFATFREVAEALGGAAAFRHLHLSNSAGVLGFEQGSCNLVRPGLMLYGLSSLEGFEGRLRAALALKSRVTLVRELPAGHGVSYGRDFVTDSPTRVATVAIGYGDGLPRHLSDRGAELLVHGQRCPVLGRVTMDQVMVDVTALDPAPLPGDEVVVIGHQGGETISAAELARKAGTIPWEILTGLTKRVPRLYD